MTFPVILSFYTKGTLYEEEARTLIASCQKFELQTIIKEIDSFGSWELNCAYKPFFIWDAMQQLNGPVLWVDADGCFVRRPEWQQEFDADLSVRFEGALEWEHPSKVITSTIFIAPTLQGRAIVRRWIKETQRQLLDPERKLEFWDQIALRNALKGWDGVLEPIPLEYAKIFDHPGDCSSVINPVIEHYQASRRLKKKIR